MSSGNGQLESVATLPVVQDTWLSRLDKYALPIVLAVAIFVFFFRLGSVGICDGSESYYPSAAREMIEANNYIVPQLNYQLLFAKPIMIFWLISAGYKLFGMDALGARFFSAVFAVGLSALTYFSARSVSNARTGLLAAFIVMASPLVLDYSRLSEIDLCFSAFLAMAFLGTMLVVSGGKKKMWPLIWVGLGAALLTKGPASVVIYTIGTGFVMALFWKERAKFVPAFWSLKPLFGIAIMLAIALPWWIAVFKATDGSFPKYFFAYENFGRAAGHTNSNPTYWFKYPAVLLIGLFPWSLLIPVFIMRTVKSLRAQYGGTGLLLPDVTGKAEPQLMDGKRVALGYGAAVVTIFSLSRTQMEPYLLPSIAPLAVYTALAFNDWLAAFSADNRDNYFVSRWTVAVSKIVAILGILVVVGGFILPSVFKLSFHQITWPLFGLPLAGLLAGGALISQYFFVRKGAVQKGLIIMAMVYAMGTAIGVESGIEAWYGNTIKDLHYLCTLLENKPGQVGFYADCRSSVLFYVKRPVYFFFQAERLVPFASYKFKIAPEALKFPLFIFTEKKHLPALQTQKEITFTTVGEKGKWGLYEVHGARLEPYETLINTFDAVPLSDLATKQLPTGPLTLPFGGGTYKHNALDPYQYR